MESLDFSHRLDQMRGYVGVQHGDLGLVSIKVLSAKALPQPRSKYVPNFIAVENLPRPILLLFGHRKPVSIGIVGDNVPRTRRLGCLNRQLECTLSLLWIRVFYCGKVRVRVYLLIV